MMKLVKASNIAMQGVFLVRPIKTQAAITPFENLRKALAIASAIINMHAGVSKSLMSRL